MLEDNSKISKVGFSFDCDYHSHILPNIDDGARNVEESLSLIKVARDKGIKRIFATPHCYLHKKNVNRFLNGRERAYKSLCETKADILKEVKIQLGAEVLLFPGINEMDGIEKLTMGDSNVLLIELPLSVSIITESYFMTVEELSRRFQIVMAHANRYSEYTVRQMLEIGADLQLNAEDVCKFSQRKRIDFWMEGNCSVALGSDVHRSATPYNKFAKARKFLTKM